MSHLSDTVIPAIRKKIKNLRVFDFMRFLSLLDTNDSPMFYLLIDLM